ncbi:TIGR03086 family metal-binding protein [Nocardia sp. BMG51109]|uniref:TIGR03086 family metal-binding protein n=1 Tax=Nocardia sp. BMG51109 TaxID=1056816 RepID=UPI000467B8FB|nr:TIGR03086 family metal-binding protein [Nocardia sp. BMG51109]
MTTVIDRIDAALDMATAIVDNTAADRLAAPSLCSGWDIGAELNHLVGGMRIFAAELAGIEAGGEHDSDWLGTDHQGAFAVAAELDRAAWHRLDALDTTVRLSFGAVPGPRAAQIHLTEVVVHAADLAVATGQDHRIDDAQCEQLLNTLRGTDFEAFRLRGMFDPERPAPAGAPGHRRLLAFLGRNLEIVSGAAPMAGANSVDG